MRPGSAPGYQEDNKQLKLPHSLSGALKMWAYQDWQAHRHQDATTSLLCYKLR